MKKEKRIYLDYAATTPIDPRVSKTMRDFELEFYGNPSSTHREGQQVRSKIDYARQAVGKFFAAKPQEIIFTSGATEANNLAIQGVVNEHYKRTKSKPHIVTTLLEHQSVYNTVKELEKRGDIEATYVKPSQGNISLEDLIGAIKPNTILVSAIFASNEIGSILPVREIGKKILELNLDRGWPIRFHVDAVQAVQFLNCNSEKINCDLLTASAHKIYGPKGIGLLFVRTGVKLENIAFGGSQEYGLRPGTQNTAGIIGFAKAIELLEGLEKRELESSRLAVLQKTLINELLKIPNTILNGALQENRIANNVSLTFEDLDQDAFMTALDLAGIAASTGSACVSGSSEPSHVIEALGHVKKAEAATLRLTLGRDCNLTDIKFAISAIIKIVNQLRS